MMRIRNKTKSDISPEQCGFVEGKSTSNVIYILRTISERALEMQNELYLCFIDYQTAFDCVKHQCKSKKKLILATSCSCSLGE